MVSGLKRKNPDGCCHGDYYSSGYSLHVNQDTERGSQKRFCHDTPSSAYDVRPADICMDQPMVAPPPAPSPCFPHHPDLMEVGETSLTPAVSLRGCSRCMAGQGGHINHILESSS